ncbi:hypothetical protein EMCRGX_G014369 [Ephydatia muelleri]|eukprot:Em0005g1544a
MASLVLEVLPKVEQLSARVIRVLGLNPGPYTLQGTNTYIVGTGEKRVLIDTGEANRPDYIQLLRETLSQAHASLNHVIITHRHLDHIGGVDGVRKMNPGLKIYKHSSSRDDDKSDDLFAHLNDGTKVEVEGATLQVIHTPGHTDDHVALLLEEEGAVFTGDCILGQGSAVFEDLGSYMHSLSRLKSLAPRVLYPGHGPAIRDSMHKIDQYIAHRLERECQVVSALDQSQGKLVTAMDLVKIIYKDLDSMLWKGAENNVLQILNKLANEGRIELVKDSCGTVQWRNKMQ